MNGRTLYIAPTTELAQEVFASAAVIARNSGAAVRLIRGRDENTCYQFAKVQEVSGMGYSPKLLTCNACPHREKNSLKPCVYFAQTRDLPDDVLIISTHAWAAHQLLQKVNIIIVDENPREAFIEKVSVGVGAIQGCQKGFSREANRAISKMMGTATELLKVLNEDPQKNSQARLYATDAPAGGPWEKISSGLWERADITTDEEEALQRDLAIYQPLFDDEGRRESVFTWMSRLWNWKVDNHALTWLFTATGHPDYHGVAYIQVKVHPTTPVLFWYYRSLFPEFDGLVKVLDGTGDKDEMDALLGRDFHLESANVDLPACRRIFLKRAMGKTKLRKLPDQQIQSAFFKATSHLSKTDKKVLVVTHLVVEEKVLEIARRMLPGRVVEATHFWASRGVNKWEDFDAVIAFGTPTANPASVLDEGMMLFQNQEDRDNWTARLGTADLVQTVHRVRPIKGGKTIIIMGREWPEDLGRPDVSLSMQKGEQDHLEAAYKRLQKFVGVHQFMTKEVAWGLGIGTTREQETVKTYRKQLVSWVKTSNYRQSDPPKKSAFSLIYSSLLDKMLFFRGGSDLPPVLVFGSNSAWNNLLAMLRRDFPHLPDLKARSKKTSGQWTKGLGTVTAARRFYYKTGLDFWAESWRGVEVRPISRPRPKAHPWPHHQSMGRYQPPPPRLPGMPNRPPPHGHHMPAFRLAA